MTKKADQAYLAIFIGILLLGCTALLNRSCSCQEANAAKPLETADYDSPTVGYVEAFTYRDGALKKNDPRNSLIKRTAKAIDTAASLYGLDPALLASCAYAESSMDPRAIGASRGETGLLQVHGLARRKCRMSGLDLSNVEGQVYCGSRWLAELSTRCGKLVENEQKCLKTRGKAACSGGLSAFISGSCSASEGVARKVGYRYRLKRWVEKQGGDDRS